MKPMLKICARIFHNTCIGMEKMKIIYISEQPQGYIGSNVHFFFPKRMSEYEQVVSLCPKADDESSRAAVVWRDYEFDLRHYTPGKRACKEIFEIIKTVNPDIVHIFRSGNSFKYAFAIRRNFPSVKIIVDIRSVLIRKRRQKLKQRFFNQLLPFVVDEFAANTIPMVKTHMWFCWKKITRVPMGFTFDAFARRVRPVPAPSFLNFIYIGTLHRARMLEVLIDGFARACARGLAGKLSIYGHGLDYEYYRDYAKEFSDAGHVEIKGAIPQQELFSIMDSYDAGLAYVPNGVYELAPSLKLMEYSAAGIPVLASDTEGHRQMREEGFRFIPFANNPESIADTLLDFASGRIGGNEQCSESFLREYDWSNVVKKHLMPLYRSLLDR